ncbi:hypothetical protein WDU94_001889 [Cyamophila willieti]
MATGCVAGWSAPAIPYLQNNVVGATRVVTPITDNEASWIASIITIDEQLRHQDNKEREQVEQIKQLKVKIASLNDEVSQLKKTRIPQKNNSLNQETDKKKVIILEPPSPGPNSSITSNLETSLEIIAEPKPVNTQQKKVDIPEPTISDPDASTASTHPTANSTELVPSPLASASTPTPAQVTCNLDQDSSSPPKISNIFLVGDSHTRDLKPIMISKLPEKCYIRSFVKPGKNIKYLVDNIKPHLIIPGTQIIFFAGTNDVFRNPWSDIKSSLEKLQKKLKDFQVLFILIPPRYDVKKINNHISRLNSLIKHELAKFPNFTYLNPTPIVPISNFRYDMIHVDRKGKHLLCNQIILKLFNKIGKVVSRSKSSHTQTYYDTRVEQHTVSNHNQSMRRKYSNNTHSIPSLLNIQVDHPYQPPIQSAPPPLQHISHPAYFAPPAPKPSVHFPPPHPSVHFKFPHIYGTLPPMNFVPMHSAPPPNPPLHKPPQQVLSYADVLKSRNSVSYSSPQPPCNCQANSNSSNSNTSIPSTSYNSQIIPNVNNIPIQHQNVTPLNFPFNPTTLV